MSELAQLVQSQLLAAIDKDDLVLPTLPEVALRIREAAEDSNISVGTLSKVIGRDAALSARLIKVVNSPMLRASTEVTELQTAVNRLGINYSCNLAIGLVIEQIFHARSPVVEQKMRDVWACSLAVAGLSHELCQRHRQLQADQGALAGLVHLIGILPILTYAEEHNELLSDPVRLNHVIEHIHPVLGDKILSAWEFPRMLAAVPGQYQQLARQASQADYADVVQVATLLNQSPGGDQPLESVPALKRLGLDPAALLNSGELIDARHMFR
ncbi:HDOD domain-containing protein [Pseudomonas sp. R5(2019)]|uniref:HDOD domain-containing protein n=1 Tax=Pseudomonas sp. R5(2019) TaxID=2697566 RepID=UPI0014133983|nr:HDOD domain-containing protein [Pseudomonas sp. R5(2019)]NBA95410.1 HDOD domain-containing protein [Pseudomonas sp. R5(2019)]